MYAAVFDTNIVIDYATGVKKAKDAILACNNRIICTLTYMELMAAVPDARLKKMIDFLEDNFDIEPLDKRAIETAVYYRNHFRMNMPDSLIYGYTRSRGLTLITRNIKAFNPHWGAIHVPYKL